MMKLTSIVKIFFFVIITIITLPQWSSSKTHEMVESPLLKEIEQKKALFYNNQKPLKKVVIVRKQPVLQSPAPVTKKGTPNNKNTTRPLTVLKFEGENGNLQAYKLVPVNMDNPDKNDDVPATMPEKPKPSKVISQPKKSASGIKETPTSDRVFIPPYKFPFFGNPYGVYSNGGFINPGLFPFVPGGPGFPPYDGVFGGPFGPGIFPGNPGNPYPNPPPGSGPNNNGLPMDIPGTLAALGYGQPPLNPTGPPIGAYSPGSPVGYKRSSTEKPPKTYSSRAPSTTPKGKYKSRPKPKPKPKTTPAPAEGASYGEGGGGCSCNNNKYQGGSGASTPAAAYQRRTTTSTTTPSSTCPCSSNKYKADLPESDNGGGDKDKYEYAPPSPSPPCPHGKPEKGDADIPEANAAPSLDQMPKPPDKPSPQCKHYPKPKSPPIPHRHSSSSLPPPPDKPRPNPPPATPCNLKQSEQNSHAYTQATTTEAPQATTAPTPSTYSPPDLPSSPSPVAFSSPQPQIVVAAATPQQPFYMTTPSPPPQNQGSSPPHNTILYKPIAQDIVHTPTSVTVPLPFPFVMDSSGVLQPQSQAQGSQVTYKLDLNSDLLTKISTPVVIDPHQQIKLVQGTGNQYTFSGPMEPPPPPQQQQQQFYAYPRSRVSGKPRSRLPQSSVVYSTEASVTHPKVVVVKPESIYNSRHHSSPETRTRRLAPRKKFASSHFYQNEYPHSSSSTDYDEDDDNEEEEEEEPPAQHVRRRYRNKKVSNDFVIIDRSELEKLQRTSTMSSIINDDYHQTTERNLPPRHDLVHLKFHPSEDDVRKPLSFRDSHYYNHNYERDKLRGSLSSDSSFDIFNRNVRSAPTRRSGSNRGRSKRRGGHRQKLRFN